ncbi:MAG: hypothetical protein PHE68_03945 [Candidatus Peribacteraceae bacterium]|nr:hypothetical protein [Candidatus Peribacteraceae bacterium]
MKFPIVILAVFFFAALTVADLAYIIPLTDSPTNKSALLIIMLTGLTFFFDFLADHDSAFGWSIGLRPPL